MAKARVVSLELEAGEYIGYSTTVKQDGVIITSLVGYKAVIRFGAAPQSGKLSTAKLELSTENTLISTDGNKFRWAVTPAQSRALPAAGFWQMMVTNPFGFPTRIFEGPVKITPEYTAPNVG